ncbi:MAG: phosphotransferase [Alphaproteobacteria bacterium]|nr:phosphotransferase [Alphaproteobacteria bacterium]
MSEREDLKRDFLARAGLAEARRQALPGDASTRAYERLHPASGPSLILMDQPPRLETQPCPPDASAEVRAALGFNALYRLAAGRIEAFVACAGHLRGLGLSAPRIVAFDAGLGLAVMEDLGDALFGPRLAAGATDETDLYAAAVDALARLQQGPAPDILAYDGVSWPLLDYDALALTTGGDLFVEWFPRLEPRLNFGDAALAEWRQVWAPIVARGAAGARVFCHRDYHAENLIWLPERTGVARVGMIDFQDAVRAHPAWDVSMLLHDARRDVSAELETAMLRRYLAAVPAGDAEAFLADYHALGALNVLRILGIFARLVVRDGKPRYRDFLPRLWTYLDRCLTPPAPTGLGVWLDRHVRPFL